MSRTPEQLAARRERSDREHGFTKCTCGNVAGIGQTKCRRCRREDEPVERRQADEIADILMRRRPGILMVESSSATTSLAIEFDDPDDAHALHRLLLILGRRDR